ncbi:uncharacterized protein LOC117324346 isoform X1 [Pecten maximus]|uniref:uncharacterized protein LOC117324346 isoform X1 n=1 Tax=Pecten maximus TaxID=6579 RepID=UPI001458B51E|nr:uncharacterized protein LOC117324346 isoform X1 [Pecten maximus]XP_033736040.1 uncharacterized protein LOC117324346 isoform X1 [Pecten maximus]
MASNFSEGSTLSITSLFKCKACCCVLKDAIKLPCGHRVCDSPCLKQLFVNSPEARCPVKSCSTDIDQTEITSDDVLRKAILEKVNQSGSRSSIIGNPTNLQALALADTQTRTLFQGTTETIQRDLTCILDEHKKIRRSLLMTMAKTGETEIRQHRETQEQLRKQEKAISRNSNMLADLQTSVSSNTRQIQHLNRCGPRVMLPGYPPS